MRSIIILFVCLFAGSLTAEMIGRVEYHLPKDGHGWKVAEEITVAKKKPSTTIIYIPENETKENAKEFFGINRNGRSLNLTNKKNLQKRIAKGMKVKFAKPKVTVTILEETPQSVLYEWAVNDSSQEKVHGWSRAFSMPKESIILTYQTEQLNTINEKRSIWVPVLKEAKIIQ